MSKMKYVHNDIEWAQKMEVGLQDYMASLWDSLDQEWESFDDAVESTELTISGQYFCGCDDCVSRETILYLIPHIIDGFKLNKFELNEEYQP